MKMSHRNNLSASSRQAWEVKRTKKRDEEYLDSKEFDFTDGYIEKQSDYMRFIEEECLNG